MKYVARSKIGCRKKEWLIVNEITGGLIAEFTGGQVAAMKEAKRLEAAAEATAQCPHCKESGGAHNWAFPHPKVLTPAQREVSK